MTQMNSRFNMMTAPPIGLDPNAQGLGLSQQQVGLQREQVRGGLAMGEKQFGLQQQRFGLEQQRMGLAVRELESKIRMEDFTKSMETKRHDLLRQTEQAIMNTREEERALAAQQRKQGAEMFPQVMERGRAEIAGLAATTAQATALAAGETMRQHERRMAFLRSLPVNRAMRVMALAALRDPLKGRMIASPEFAEKALKYANDYARGERADAQGVALVDMVLTKGQVDLSGLGKGIPAELDTHAARVEIERAMSKGEPPKLSKEWTPEMIKVAQDRATKMEAMMRESDNEIAGAFAGPAPVPPPAKVRQVFVGGLSPAEQVELGALEKYAKEDPYRFGSELRKPKRLAELKARPPGHWEDAPAGQQFVGPPAPPAAPSDPWVALKDGYQRLSGAKFDLYRITELAIDATIERDPDLKKQWQNGLDRELSRPQKVMLLHLLNRTQTANAKMDADAVVQRIQQVKDELLKMPSFQQADAALRDPTGSSAANQAAVTNALMMEVEGKIDSMGLDADLRALEAADSAAEFAADNKHPDAYALADYAAKLQTDFVIKYKGTLTPGTAQ